jgi:hypothetical protein
MGYLSIQIIQIFGANQRWNLNSIADVHGIDSHSMHWALSSKMAAHNIATVTAAATVITTTTIRT